MAETPDAPSSDINEFQEALRNSENIVVIASPTLSERSHIPSLKRAGAIWRGYNAISLLSTERFKKSPSLIWQFFHYRRELMRKAKPNDAHWALASLAQPYVRRQLLGDGNSSFALITQCVDSLQQRSNEEVARVLAAMGRYEPVQNVFEMFGSVFSILCTKTTCPHVKEPLPMPGSLNCDALIRTEDPLRNVVIDKRDLPHCSQCGALVRPGVVWYEERARNLVEVKQLLKKADLCILIGSGDLLKPLTIDNLKGKKLAIFNPEVTPEDMRAKFLFVGPCEELLPKALGLSKVPFFTPQ